MFICDEHFKGMHFTREGRNAWLNRLKKGLFQGLGRDLDKITMEETFIPLMQIVIVIERQVLRNWWRYLRSQSLHNSARVGLRELPAWWVDALLHKNINAYITADAPSLPMHFVGVNRKLVDLEEERMLGRDSFEKKGKHRRRKLKIVVLAKKYYTTVEKKRWLQEEPILYSYMQNYRWAHWGLGSWTPLNHRKVISPHEAIWVLANGGILPGIFLGISVEMVLAGLREGYPWNSQEYPSLKPASTISTDIPRNIPENIPPLARAFWEPATGFLNKYVLYIANYIS